MEARQTAAPRDAAKSGARVPLLTTRSSSSNNRDNNTSVTVAAVKRGPATRVDSDQRKPLKPKTVGNQSLTSLRSASSVSVNTSTKSESATTKKKIDEILKRTLPHGIVQSYDKINAALKITVAVAVNGEPLVEVLDNAQGPVSAKWSAQQETAAAKAHSSKKQANAFHYARSVQYIPPHPELSLETLKTVEVSVTSSSTGHTTRLLIDPPSLVLTKKAWRRVTETDAKIGLALYELSLGPWQASSLLVLVWAKTLEIVNIYLQLHVAELLYSCPPRAIRILPDDVDPVYGLHSYTAAITIRDFHRVVHWENEWFSIQFPALSGPQYAASVDLLDEESGYRDRARFISSPLATSIATDAISIPLESALIVDFTLWEASCNPVWGFTKLLPVANSEAPRSASDFSMSVAGSKRDLIEIKYCDPKQAGNTLHLQLERPRAQATTTTTTNRSVFVKQISLQLGVTFINQTFGTNYPVRAKS